MDSKNIQNTQAPGQMNAGGTTGTPIYCTVM
jgi:hypothetical protein